MAYVMLNKSLVIGSVSYLDDAAGEMALILLVLDVEMSVLEIEGRFGMCIE